MERARQALNEATEGTYGFLAAQALRQRVEDIPHKTLKSWKRLCWKQLSGLSSEGDLKNLLFGALSNGENECDTTGDMIILKQEVDLFLVSIEGGLHYLKTPLSTRLIRLWRISQVEGAGLADDSSSVQSVASSPSVTGSHKRKASTAGLESRANGPGFKRADVGLLFENRWEDVNVVNGTVEIKSYPRRPNSRTFSPSSPASKPETTPLSDELTSASASPSSRSDHSYSTAASARKEVSQKRMQNVRDQFSQGLCQAISYLLLSAQMKSGWLGMFYLGSKFSRLAAISPDTVAIEFGNRNPYLWNWVDDPEFSPASSMASRPPESTVASVMEPTLVEIDDLFLFPKRYWERLGHELVNHSTMTRVKNPDLNFGAVQTMLDFFVAAAFDRLHLPTTSANTALNWDMVADCHLHNQLLSLSHGNVHVNVNDAMYDTLAWRSGPNKVTKKVVKTFNRPSPTTAPQVAPHDLPPTPASIAGGRLESRSEEEGATTRRGNASHATHATPAPVKNWFLNSEGNTDNRLHSSKELSVQPGQMAERQSSSLPGPSVPPSHLLPSFLPDVPNKRPDYVGEVAYFSKALDPFTAYGTSQRTAPSDESVLRTNISGDHHDSVSSPEPVSAVPLPPTIFPGADAVVCDNRQQSTVVSALGTLSRSAIITGNKQEMSEPTTRHDHVPVNGEGDRDSGSDSNGKPGSSHHTRTSSQDSTEHSSAHPDSSDHDSSGPDGSPRGGGGGRIVGRGDSPREDSERSYDDRDNDGNDEDRDHNDTGRDNTDRSDSDRSDGRKDGSDVREAGSWEESRCVFDDQGSSYHGDGDDDYHNDDNDRGYWDCGGLLYDPEEVRLQEELDCQHLIRAFKELGIKFIAISTASMDQIIDEHIRAVDRSRGRGSPDGPAHGAGAASASSIPVQHTTPEGNKRQTRTRVGLRKSDESISSPVSNPSSVRTFKSDSSFSSLGLRTRPSSFYTDTSMSSAGSSFRARMRSLSTAGGNSNDSKSATPTPLPNLTVSEQPDRQLPAAMETDQ